ncbi:MAG TPA: type II toxin-antitoxin system mRNA interferase toxin, RelE/StbE family [Candidatus Omnitrophica bacterium]|nr:type II toxin-antitoxin system mRNA interferase toxin, RelE/StbE family [Candidatus Omnitrophota bacterium]
MYRIIIERKAAKEIECLPNDTIQRVTDAIKNLKLNPRPHGSKKLTGEAGWRVRIGDYRILYTIDDSQKLITIYRVKHRKEAYR